MAAVAAMVPPKKAQPGNTSRLMPSELMDKCVGQRMWVSASTMHGAKGRAAPDGDTALARP